MNLIFIYGPPGVGKFTVGKELSKLTGIKLFHNHLTLNLAESIFPKAEDHWELSNKLRFVVFEEAAKKNVDLIFTLVYGVEIDNEFVRKVVQVIEKHKGGVLFVQLLCERKELEKRILVETRKELRKINDLGSFENLSSKFDLFSSIPFVENLKIDNTSLSPETTAKKIAEHYQLSGVKK